MRLPTRPPRGGLAPLTVAALSVVALLSLTACAGRGGSGGPTWVPQPAYTLEPNPVAPGSGPAGTTREPPSGAVPTPSPSGSSSATAPVDPAIVATGLSAPVGITVLPDGTALVGQRTSGVIVRVQPTAGQPVTTVRTIPGLDATGDGGLLDLALSPAYSQDHLIYAYVTTATDNRVVDFTLTGPITPVFTGIPKGATGNAGRITFGVDGSLLIGTGDAGQPALAQDRASLAGKVLEVNDVGQPIQPGAPVLTTGQHSLAGLCTDAGTAATFETEPDGEVNLLVNGGDYGWPQPTPTSIAPLAVLPVTTAGQRPVPAGCAVTDGVLYVASLDGTALYSANITQATTTIKLDPLTATLTGQYGRLITVVADPDGSLWLATSNTGVTPAPTGSSPTADERILHIQPSGGGATSQA